MYTSVVTNGFETSRPSTTEPSCMVVRTMAVSSMMRTETSLNVEVAVVDVAGGDDVELFGLGERGAHVDEHRLVVEQVGERGDVLGGHPSHQLPIPLTPVNK